MKKLMLLSFAFGLFALSTACGTSAEAPKVMNIIESFQDDTNAYRIYTIEGNHATMYYYALACDHACKPRMTGVISATSRAIINSTLGMAEIEGKLMITTRIDGATSREVNEAHEKARLIVKAMINEKIAAIGQKKKTGS